MVWGTTQNYYNPLVRISSDKITIPIHPLSEEERIKILNDKALEMGVLEENSNITKKEWLAILQFIDDQAKNQTGE